MASGHEQGHTGRHHQISTNPHLHEHKVDAVTSTAGRACRACMEGKLTPAAHKHTVHEYRKVEVFSTDIMVPLHISPLPPGEDRYFISFY